MGRLDELRAQLISAGNHEELPARKCRRLLVALAVGWAVGACDGSAGAGAEAAASTPAAPVDSILPMDELTRRFREGLPEVRQLSGGATSRDALVTAFVLALERSDTAAIQGMQVSRAEYAHLYFPSSIYMRPPYRQPPAVAWFLNSENSTKGISRVLGRLGGRSLEFRGYTCLDESAEGNNSFFRSCALDYFDRDESARVNRRLFGTIIARDGHYKFLSYSNDF